MAIKKMVLCQIVLGVACSHRSGQQGECGRSTVVGRWAVQMAARDSGEFTNGFIDLSDKGGSTRLLSTSAEGTKEEINYPVTSLELQGDSLTLKFAPAEFTLRGRCITRDSIGGTYSVPNPPFSPILGTWGARRSDSGK